MPDRASESKQEALDKLYAYKKRLESDLASLSRKLEAAQLSIALLTGNEPPDIQRLASVQRSNYAGLPAQRAVEVFLRAHPGTDFRASEVAKHLLRDGFVSRARNFSSQVGVSLNRLAEKGTAHRQRDGNVWVYCLKESPPKTP